MNTSKDTYRYENGPGNDLNKFIADLERGLRQCALPTDNYRILAKAYESKGDYSSARNAIKRLISIRLDSTYTHEDMHYNAQLLEKMELYQDALSEYLECIEFLNVRRKSKYNRDIHYNYNRALAYDNLSCARICLKLKREEDAIQYLEKAANHGAETREEVAKVRKKIRAKQSVQQACSKANQNNFMGTIADCTEALNIDKDNLDAYDLRAVARLDVKDYHGCIADCNNMLRIDAGNKDAFYTRSLARDYLGLYSDALDDINTAIEYDSQQYKFYSLRARIKKKLRKYEAAIKDYNKAINLAPHVINLYINRADTHLEKGNYQHAIQDSEIALGLNPQSGTAYANRGIAKERLNDIAGAIEDYQKAVALGELRIENDLNRLMLSLAEKEHAKNRQSEETLRQQEAREREQQEVGRNARHYQKQRSAQDDFFSAFSALKLECSNRNRREASEIHEAFEQLEPQALQLRSVEFYLERGKFYETSAQTEAVITRKKGLQENAILAYRQAMEINTFAKGAAERIEALEQEIYSKFSAMPNPHPPSQPVTQPSSSQDGLSTAERAKVEAYKQQMSSGQRNITTLSLDEQLLKAFKDNASEEVIQGLIDAGADVDMVDPKGELGLVYACGRNGCYDLAKALLEGGTNPNTREPIGKNRTVLILAISFHHSNIVELLLKYGADPSLKDKDGTDAKCMSQMLGNLAIIQLLNSILSDTQKATSISSFQQQPSTSAVSSTSSNSTHLSAGEYYEAEYDFESDLNGTLCCKTGEILRLIRKKANGWWICELNGQQGEIPSKYLVPTTKKPAASHSAHPTSATISIATFQQQPSTSAVCPTSSNSTHLSAGEYYETEYDFESDLKGTLSCKTGEVLRLIRKKANGWWICELNGQQGEIPSKYLVPTTKKPMPTHAAHPASANISTETFDEQLLSACINNLDIKRVRELLKAGANVNAISVNGDSALMWCLVKDNYEVAKELLEQGANPNTKNAMRSSPLLYASGAKKWRLVKLLSANRVDANCSDTNGETALHFSCSNEGDDEVAELLLKIGAKPNSKNTNGWSPFTLAANWKRWDTVKLLARYQTNLDEVAPYGLIALNFAIQCGEYSVIEALLKAGANPNCRDANGWTPLSLAINEKQWNSAKLIITYNPKLDEAGSHCEAPLICVCGNDAHYATAEALLKAGANPNIQPLSGQRNTPLILAISWKQQAIVKLLLEYKASPTIKDSEGRDAFWWATNSGDQEIIAALNAATGKSLSKEMTKPHLSANSASASAAKSSSTTKAISTAVGLASDEYYEAVYAYESELKDALPCKAGDIIKLVQKKTNGWFICELNGRQGEIPSKYLKPAILPAISLAQKQAQPQRLGLAPQQPSIGNSTQGIFQQKSALKTLSPISTHSTSDSIEDKPGANKIAELKKRFQAG